MMEPAIEKLMEAAREFETREDVRLTVTLRHYGLRRCLLHGGCLWAVEVELADGSVVNLGGFDRLPDANSALEQFIRDTEDIQ